MPKVFMFLKNLGYINIKLKGRFKLFWKFAFLQCGMSIP